MNHATSDIDLAAFLAAQLSDSGNQWSVGSFGAIAEFMRDGDEPAKIESSERGLSALTARGGIRIAPTPDMRLFASESASSSGWNHRISLCLPEHRCAMNRRRVLTERGPDIDALREQDRPAILFDLGLDAMQVDACVRIADPRVAAALRPHLGRGVFEAGNPAMSIIVPASPHRVFISRLGRVEVFAPIPPPDGKSPEGPHTHVLPKLLKHARTHAATEPVPDGFVPCAHLYPAHPLKDALGRPTAFDALRHGSFQRLLAMFGDPDAIDLKHRIVAAVRNGEGSSTLSAPEDRFGRGAVRIALRQLQASGNATSALADWLAAHDRTPVADRDNSQAHHEA